MVVENLDNLRELRDISKSLNVRRTNTYWIFLAGFIDLCRCSIDLFDNLGEVLAHAFHLKIQFFGEIKHFLSLLVDWLLVATHMSRHEILKVLFVLGEGHLQFILFTLHEPKRRRNFGVCLVHFNSVGVHLSDLSAILDQEAIPLGNFLRLTLKLNLVFVEIIRPQR